MTVTPHILVISHRRSGTHLLLDALRNNLFEYRAPFLSLDRLTGRSTRPAALDEIRRELDEAPRVIKTHMHTDIAAYFDRGPRVVGFVEDLCDSMKLIYVHRDGRDVLTSLYFYMRTFKRDLRKISLSEFLRTTNDLDNPEAADMNRVEYWKEHVARWSRSENLFFTSFEQLSQNFDATLQRLSRFVGASLPPMLRSVVRTTSFGSRIPIVGRVANKFYSLYTRHVANVELTSVAFRSGAVGAHREVFASDDLDFFDATAADVMRELGYYDH